jgi:hypothetical protein
MMSRLRVARLCAFTAAMFLSACATQAPDRGEDSRILAVTTANGRAIPQGRSDTADAHFSLSGMTDDPGYGHSSDNPIKVGGVRQGPVRERMYLNALRGPGGEPVVYERLGSCCPFPTPNGFAGGGLLDAFRVTYEGQASPVTLYLNMYDEGPLLIPVGFAARGEDQAR